LFSFYQSGFAVTRRNVSPPMARVIGRNNFKVRIYQILIQLKPVFVPATYCSKKPCNLQWPLHFFVEISESHINAFY